MCVCCLWNGLEGVHNKEAHKSPDRHPDVMGVFKDDTKLCLKCYLTCSEVTLPHKMYDDDPDLPASHETPNCAPYRQKQKLVS